MFDNIAKKIKAVIYVCFAFGCLASFAVAILRMINVINQRGKLDLEESLGVILISVFIFAVGSFISWIGCFLLYGFAELIERVTHIDEILSGKAGNVYKEEANEYDTESTDDQQLKAILNQQLKFNEEVSDEEEPFHNTIDQ